MATGSHPAKFQYGLPGILILPEYHCDQWEKTISDLPLKRVLTEEQNCGVQLAND